MPPRVLSSFVLGATLVALAPALADVPAGPPRVSPMASVSQVVGVSEVSIVYSRPAVRERVVWGELVPFGEVWRTGANEATTFTISDDAKIDGEPLAAGSYALFSIPGETEWTLIFNRVADQWGAFGYDAAQDALRVPVKPRAAGFKERFEIGFSDVGADSAKVSLRWADVEVPFDVRFDVRQAALEAAREFVANASPQDGRMVWNWANYCYQNDIALDEARGWAESLAEAAPMYWTQALAARLKAATGDTPGAIAAAELALARVEAEADQPGVSGDSQTLESELESWRGSD